MCKLYKHIMLHSLLTFFPMNISVAIIRGDRYMNKQL